MTHARTSRQSSVKNHSKQTKVKKGMIVNEKIFGKSLEEIDPKAGMTELAIQADEIGNIPGTIEHWQHDIALRKKDIVKYTERTFMQRAAGILKRDLLSAGTNGYELVKFHPLKKNEELVKELKTNPQNALIRLQLVSNFGKVNRNFPVEFYRSMLLQSMVACSLGEISIQGLQIAIWAQNTYFQKLSKLCKDYLDKLKSNLEGIKDSDHSFRQRRPIEEKIKEVQRNINILRTYQEHANKPMKEVIGADFTISLGEIQNTFLSTTGEKSDKNSKQMIVKKVTGVINILRYILLLHPNAHELVDLLIRLDNKNPIGHFLKARISMSAMVFSVGRYEGGERTAGTKKEVQEHFKEAYHQYGLAVKKMGKVVKGTTQYSILIEYANIILYFYQIANHLLKIKLPKPWIQTAMQRAYRALVMAQESGKTDEMEKLLSRVIETENLNAEEVLAYS
ncbi:MAG: hypothetical protein HQM13_02950 [SAR324 cluster bacterium]|nr:hypothetical protein [SAR324 cluster bacterium]